MRPCTRRRTVSGVFATVVALALTFLAARFAAASDIEILEPSARSGGMGGAGVAVGWGSATDTWQNPAFVAGRDGFTVRASVQQLLPTIANDLHLRATEFAVSYAGLGFATAGRPFGGETMVQPLQEFFVDPVGGTFYATGFMETMESNAAAVSAVGLADAVRAAAHLGGGRIADWADVSWGQRWKRVATSNGTYSTLMGARDQGWNARVTPWNTRRGSAAHEGGARVELAFGRAWLNEHTNPPYAWAGVLHHVVRTGGAVRYTWWGPERGEAPGSPWTDAFRGAFSPLVDLTLAWDRIRFPAYVVSDRRPDPAPPRTVHDIDELGAEFVLARVLTLRLGHVNDPSGDVRKLTWGVGASLPLRRVGELRYDLASWPQSYDHAVYRHQLTLHFDPFAPRGDRAVAAED